MIGHGRPEYPDSYAALYIFGFCKASKNAPVPSYCQVVTPSFFINKLIDFDDEDKVQVIVDTVRRHVNYSSLHPHDDIECLKIVLGYVGRNAVRHRMSCEGSLDDMTKGLKEISELIGKGTVNGKQKSKAHHEFNDQEIGRFLRHVLNHIGEITVIVNRSNRNGFVCLNQQDMMKIDRLKESITTSAKDVAARHNIVSPLGMHDLD